jgi:aminomethyltransferase
LKEAIAMAIIENGFAAAGQKIEVDVRGRRIEAVVVELPFYKKK